MILNIVFLSLLIGYSLAVATSVRATIKMKKEVARIENEELPLSTTDSESRAVLPDPDNTASSVAAMSSIVLFLVLFLLLLDPEFVFFGDMVSAVNVGVIGFLFVMLPWAFYSVISGSYDIAIFSEGGIRIRMLTTGVESDISWNQIESFSYSIGSHGAFQYYTLKAGKRSMEVGPTGKGREKTILMLAVQNVPRRLWRKDIEAFLRLHFGIVVGNETERTSQ